MATSKAIKIIDVPTDIGSMIKGKSLAPEAINAADLSGKLSKLGYSVEKINALPNGPATWTYRPEIPKNGVRNEAQNVEVCHRVKDTVSAALKTESNGPLPFPIIIGGGCDIFPAIMSAFWHSRYPQRVGLLYVDGDCDLSIPNEPDASYNLASMTLTHLSMREGALESMRPFTRPDGSGVCDAANTVLFGLNAHLQGNTRAQMAWLFDEGYRVFTSSGVAGDAVGPARKAVRWLEERTDVFLVHFDVDVIDATVFPLANVANRTGLGFEGVMEALKVVLGSGKCGGLCVAEVNPTHDPGGVMTGMLVDGLVDAFRERIGAGGK